MHALLRVDASEEGLDDGGDGGAAGGAGAARVVGLEGGSGEVVGAVLAEAVAAGRVDAEDSDEARFEAHGADEVELLVLFFGSGLVALGLQALASVLDDVVLVVVVAGGLAVEVVELVLELVDLAVFVDELKSRVGTGGGLEGAAGGDLDAVWDCSGCGARACALLDALGLGHLGRALGSSFLKKRKGLQQTIFEIYINE